MLERFGKESGITVSHSITLWKGKLQRQTHNYHLEFSSKQAQITSLRKAPQPWRKWCPNNWPWKEPWRSQYSLQAKIAANLEVPAMLPAQWIWTQYREDCSFLYIIVHDGLCHFQLFRSSWRWHDLLMILQLFGWVWTFKFANWRLRWTNCNYTNDHKRFLILIGS